MILSDGTIREYLQSGIICITPFDDSQIEPASIDLTLGRDFLTIDPFLCNQISLDQEPLYSRLETGYVIIPPLSFVLGTTNEYISLPNHLTAFVEGRSSIGRLGLFIQNAGWVDPGFDGQITLELFNASPVPIRLTAGRRICQLVIAEMTKEAERPYSGKYQGQFGTTGSLIHKDREAGTHS